MASDPQWRIALAQALASQGYHKLCASKFSEALALAVHTRPHVFVICADQRGNGPALEMARKLRRACGSSHCLLIADAGDPQGGWSDLADQRLQVMSRPFSLLAFVAAVDDATNRKRGGASCQVQNPATSSSVLYWQDPHAGLITG
ncbi:MAG: hypothetical protein GTO53_12835 [Planctomycetales bacterium]|nr:hypothetical protein [Planctomycetales bacterium]NIM09985.1 hypothetical protein [Planctomycetales bacterium]NIN09423.1 hypothetical protein [Planctomycetales bacterium]NIN78530.1 hypothetical protein [Planctomycetales bacterium]NIO35723.1 hypothetical protein [Planctomycetales bacterium]